MSDYLNQYIQNLHQQLGANSEKSVITIGNFDGLHLAHQKLITCVLDIARTQACHAVAIILNPHPAEIFIAKKFKKLTTVEMRKNLILELAAKYSNVEIECLILDFTLEISKYSAAYFCQKILIEQLNLAHLVVGYDFRMGSKAYNQSLESLAETQNFALTRLDAQKIDINKSIISSSNIRHYLENGDLARAKEMLGRDYSLSGTIIHGFDRGAKILGIPTANIFNDEMIIPQKGVYQTRVRLNDSPRKYYALTNVGTNPSFNNENISIESHILDFNKDIYGQKLTIEFTKKIRNEQKFENLDELKAQILADIESARA